MGAWRQTFFPEPSSSLGSIQGFHRTPFISPQGSHDAYSTSLHVDSAVSEGREVVAVVAVVEVEAAGGLEDWFVVDDDAAAR